MKLAVFGMAMVLATAGATSAQEYIAEPNYQAPQPFRQLGNFRSEAAAIKAARAVRIPDGRFVSATVNGAPLMLSKKGEQVVIAPMTPAFGGKPEKPPR